MEEQRLANLCHQFFDDIAFRLRIVNESAKSLNVFMASNFNVFKYIEANENKLSDILLTDNLETMTKLLAKKESVRILADRLLQIQQTIEAN